MSSIDITTSRLFNAAGGAFSVTGSLMVVGALVLGGIARAILLSHPAWAVTVENSLTVALENYHQPGNPGGPSVGARYRRPAFALAVRKVLATFLTIGPGGAGGLVAPMVTISEAIGAGWARITGARSLNELRTYQLSAIAAAIATLFHTPFTGALFAAEIVRGNRIAYRKFVYCLLAGVVAYSLSQYLVPFVPLYVVPPHTASFGLVEYAVTTLVAVFVSTPIALGFAWIMTRARILAERTRLRSRAVLGSLLTGLVAVSLWYALAIDPRYVLGIGRENLGSIFLARDPQLGLWWFLLAVVAGRMLTTAFTLAGSGSAGLFLPAALFGGLSGAAVAEFLNATALFGHLDPKLPMVVGIASALVAVIRVPLAAVALSIEVFGPAYVPAAALSCAITFLISVRVQIYRSQPS
ncbi:MAG: chloride channel protein [Gammaproteobacteria bacterium]|nr:chloride channel protein [Gammaproteobacteria bacterium]